MDLYAFFQSEVKPTIGCTEPGPLPMPPPSPPATFPRSRKASGWRCP